MIEWPGLEGYEVGRVYTVDAPTYIQVSKKRTEALNLNVYRNLHHHYLDKQKKNFHAEVKTRLAELPHLEQIAIHYEIFAPRNNRLDTMNVGSITDKYFSDTLVEAKKILDDNYKHIVATSFSFGGIDRMNGHAKITIYELKKELPMRVLLDDNDIQIALENFVAEAGIAGATGVEISTKDGNLEAEVLFGDAPAEDKPAPKKRGGRPRGSKNKAKVEETADANDDTEADSTGNSDTGSDGVSEDPEKAEGSKGKANPFEEKGTQSSDSAGKTEETEVSGDPEPEVKKEEKDETPGATATKAKKSSIFDM